jgi:hypothetical protein
MMGQQHGQLEAPVEARQGGLLVPAADLAGQVRQKHHSQADADQPQRQLVNPVGEVEIGDGAGLKRGNDCRHQEVHLHGAGGQDSGNH